MKSRSRSNKLNTGDEIIRGLTGMRDALAAGQRLPERFTMRTVELQLEPRDWTPEEIKALRERLKASQSIFALLIGTSTKTVQSWEQGNMPPPMASRLLECIEKDPGPWEKMLHAAVRAA